MTTTASLLGHIHGTAGHERRPVSRLHALRSRVLLIT